MLTTLFASGVQSRLSSRVFLDHQEQTLPHQAMIEVHMVGDPLFSGFLSTLEPLGPAETLQEPRSDS